MNIKIIRILFAVITGFACAAIGGIKAECDEIPIIAQKVVANKEFFLTLKGYDEYMLHDLVRVKGNVAMIGLSLFDSTDILHYLFFDAQTQDVVYNRGEIPSKAKRESMVSRSITISDAKKLARFAQESEDALKKDIRDTREREGVWP